MQTLEALELFIQHGKYKNLSDQTLQRYRWALGRLVEPSGEVPTDPATIEGMIGDPELAAESRLTIWRVCRTFYGWLERQEVAPNVMALIPPPRVRSQLPRTLSDDEVMRLFEVCEDMREQGMVALALDTGIRVGELGTIRRRDILDGGIHVTGKSGSRFVPMSDQVRGLLDQLGSGDHVWIGSRGPLTINGVQQAIRRTMYRAGIYPPGAGPHTLRHTFGRMYLMAGGDVRSLQRIMGHSKVESTMRYVRMSTRDLIEQHRRYTPLQRFNIPTLGGSCSSS